MIGKNNNIKGIKRHLSAFLVVLVLLSFSRTAKATDEIKLPTILRGKTSVLDTYMNRTMYTGFTGNEAVYNYTGSYEEGNGQVVTNKKVAIAAGQYQSCALKSDTTVVCWGWNPQGYLGDGTTNESKIPVQVLDLSGAAGSKLSGVVGIFAGGVNTCALLSDTTVACWGKGEYGRNGDGDTFANNLYPVRVLDVGGAAGSRLSNVISVGIGSNHMCALRKDSSVVCWGRQLGGLLGNGNTADATIPYPVVVKASAGVGNLTDVSSIGVGSAHTCALKNNGNVVCWGQGANYHLGNNTLLDKSIPASVLDVGGSGQLSSVVSLDVGLYSSCAVRNDNSIVCWGYNNFGQIGDGTTADAHFPVTLKNSGGSVFSSPIIAISVGGYHACVVKKSDQSVACWGKNTQGQLGDGTNNLSMYPVAVRDLGGAVSSKLTSVIDVKLGQDHSFASKEDGSVVSWGQNNKYQLGDGTAVSSNVPINATNTDGLGYMNTQVLKGTGYELFGFDRAFVEGCLNGIIISQTGLNQNCYVSNTNSNNMRVMTSRTWIEGLDNPLFETAALVKKNGALVVGDVYGDGFDFSYWGRNIAQSSDAANSDAFLGVGKYVADDKAKITITSSQYGQYKAKVNALAAEATEIASPPAGTIRLQAGGSDFTVNSTSDINNYPNGKVWKHTESLTLNSGFNYSGKGTIIVKGDLTLSGTINRSADTDQLGFIVYGNVTIAANSVIHAPILALGSGDFNGNISIGSNAKLFGAFAANTFNNISKNAEIYYDKRLDADWPPGFRELNLSNGS